MARRSSKEIEEECGRLVRFGIAFLRLLPSFRKTSAEYYERKAKTLQDYVAPSPSIKLRGVKMGVSDLLEMTDDLSTKDVAVIDQALKVSGNPTLSTIRLELGQ